MAEAKSGEVKIDDFEAEVIEAMIYFIYNDDRYPGQLSRKMIMKHY